MREDEKISALITDLSMLEEKLRPIVFQQRQVEETLHNLLAKDIAERLDMEDEWASSAFDEPKLLIFQLATYQARKLMAKKNQRTLNQIFGKNVPRLEN